MNKPQYIAVHHTAVSYSKNPAQFNATNNYHKSQGFPLGTLTTKEYPNGMYVGYHYMIEKDGTTIQARKESDGGAHTSQDGINFKSIGICFTGNFDIEEPTLEQVDSAVRLIEYIQRQYKIPDNKVLPHRHWAGYKSCWGSKMSNDILDDLRERLKANEMPNWAIPAFAAAKKFGYSDTKPLEIIATIRGRQALAKDPLLKGHLEEKNEPLMYCEYVTALFKAGRFN